ncbi:GNAT family N-acetyltransferase [Streptomyces sulphureus]|uniref:GNAT family N-acetyltransferase n=1 Tax=Streptomyces sulphureus TaxID=47758 RepID=UPI0003621B92|nr:GNAT family N-acetyltransferase [Streptomyces sulphureus]
MENTADVEEGRPSAAPGGEAVLDEQVLAALTGPHAHLAERRGRVLRYRPDVAVWWALPSRPEPEDWDAAARLAGPGAELALVGSNGPPPPGWRATFRVPGFQMVDDGRPAAADPEIVRLGPADMPEMLRLVGATKPGPFRSGALQLGEYLGLRRDGELIAMAGERLRLPGWTELSAVCTDPRFRGEGLAARLVSAVAARVRARGDRPYLGVAQENAGAVRLYERLGFRVRREVLYHGIEVPNSPE